MAVCHDYRIPHSEFLSWPKSDRDKAIWHHLRERDRCGSCGTRSSEWDESQGGDRDAYRAVLRRCRGCELSESARERIDKQSPGRGVYVALTRG